VLILIFLTINMAGALYQRRVDRNSFKVSCSVRLHFGLLVHRTQLQHNF